MDNPEEDEFFIMDEMGVTNNDEEGSIMWWLKKLCANQDAVYTANVVFPLLDPWEGEEEAEEEEESSEEESSEEESSEEEEESE